MKNLDAIINKVGYEIVEKIKRKGKDKSKYKNFIDKALGVLANDGVYAYWVYCQSNSIDDVFINELKDIKEIINNEQDNQKFFQNLSEDLNKLLFFKEMLEKALIYARYHAKTISD